MTQLQELAYKLASILVGLGPCLHAMDRGNYACMQPTLKGHAQPGVPPTGLVPTLTQEQAMQEEIVQVDTRSKPRSTMLTIGMGTAHG